jgi:heat shock protein HslJ
MRKVLLVGVLALVAIGCSDDDGGGDGDAVDLGGTAWTLDTLGGEPPVADGVPTLEFGTDGTVSGTTGCNQYGGSYEADGDQLTITMGPMTLAACSAELDQQQQDLLDAFEATASFSGGGEGFLELADENGDVLATFAPPEP